MAEANFDETFHQTQADRFYDDHNEGSASIDIKPQPDASPYYAINDGNAPPLPLLPTLSKLPNLTNFKPEPYDGNTDPRFWLRNFESLADAFAFNEEQRFRVIRLYLKPPALTYYQNNDKSFGNSWQKFKQMFVSRFTHSLHDILLNEAIIRESQSGNTGVDQYWESRLSLLNMSSPGMSSNDKMNNLFTGLREELRLEVMANMVNRKCESLEELRVLVKETDELMKYRKSLQKPEPHYFRRSYANALIHGTPKPISNEGTNTRPSDADVRRLEMSVNNLQKILKKQNGPNTGIIGDDNQTGQAPRQYRTEPKSFGPRSLNPRNDKYANAKKSKPCYRCNKFGHWANECTAPRADALPMNEGKQSKQGNGLKRD